jgi:Na+-driven multidrug efflux pump
VGYMRAIGVSQVFMCLEYVSVGTFNGMSKTYIPPLVSIVFTALRIPLALWLVQYFGLVGVWYSISLSSILKGSVLYVWMRIILSKGEFSSESYV